MLACRVRRRASRRHTPGAFLRQAPARPHPLGDARPAPAALSRRSAPSSSCASSSPGSTSAPGHRLLGSGGVARGRRAAPGLRGGGRAPGSRRSCRPAWRATTPPCSTSGARGARSPSAGSAVRAGDRPGARPRRGGATPSPATPISLYRREDLDWLLAAAPGRGGCPSRRASGRRSRSSRRCGATGPCSSPTCAS